MSSLVRGKIRITSRPRVSMRMAQPSASMTSIDSVLLSSQGRAAKACGFDVSAPAAEISVPYRALVLVEAAGIDAVGHRLILQIAFAALVADRAIERMIDQQKFHHAFARLAHHRRAREQGF